MQKIKHDQGYKNILPIMDEMEQLYSELSDSEENIPTQKSLWKNTYDSVLFPIRELFDKYLFTDFIQQSFEVKPARKMNLPQLNPKNIIVCYSGGKDSFSVIRHYQKKGYNVYAYHIRGLNKTYYDEWEVAEQMANQLGVPIYIDHVSYSGQHIYKEHPMKNMLMANMALTWGIQNNISTKIAVGSFYTVELSDVAFDVCGGDCRDTWDVYENVIRKFIPNFKIYVANKNYQTAYNALLTEPQYLPMTISCLTPNRFRQSFRDRTLSNYPNISLLPRRCGCCWKCAVEYIWFCDHNVLEYNRDYYLHCIEILAHTIEQEDKQIQYNVGKVWEHYLFYPMKKSKAYEELKDAIICSRKIQVIH